MEDDALSLKKIIEDRVLSDKHDLIQIIEIGDVDDFLVEYIIEEMNGDKEKRWFFLAGRFWRVFVYVDDQSRSWVSILRLTGRCLKRYVRADGYCPDCNDFHHSARSNATAPVVHKKKDAEAYKKWWREHNPYMLDKLTPEERAEHERKIAGDRTPPDIGLTDTWEQEK